MAPAPQNHSEIQWRDYSETVFEQARQQGKLLLLDSGATWCHWCHVMDRVTYEDPQVVALVNERFIPVRIDRDRRPELDAQLQQASSMVQTSSQGGWPLTVVLTPNGAVLWKATFLPPRADPAYGAQTGLIDILTRLDDYYQANPQEVNQAARQYLQDRKETLGRLFDEPGEVTGQLIETILSGVIASHDAERGGFGHAPKFFAATSLRLLMRHAWAGRRNAQETLTRTLDAMARGGVYDHIGGGFHRYSVDARWHVPHFEKMAYDNAALLAIYADAYALTGREVYAQVAGETISFIRRVLTSPDHQGFYATQDADVGLDDDGDTFTWTVGEIRDALGEDAPAVLDYYRVDARGDMEARPGRNVLHVTGESGPAPTNLDELKSRLLEARRKRPQPSVDQTVFADLNGMVIHALVTAANRLDADDVAELAVGHLDTLLETLRDDRGIFAHYRDGQTLHGVGRLADQAWMARALLSAWQRTGREDYLTAASTLGEFIIRELTDTDGGLLSKPPVEQSGPTAVAPQRRWDDAPSRSAASVATSVLVDLGYLTGNDRFSQAAGQALVSSAGAVETRMGTFLGGYALAVDRYLNGPRSGAVVGNGSGELLNKTRQNYLPAGLVFALDPATQGDWLDRLGYEQADETVVYLCAGRSCFPPARTVSELNDRLETLRRQSSLGE
jgi:hypothetical protein